MGIFEWVKSQTRVWGPALLDAYIHNAGWINALLISYGLMLLLSWQNLSKICDSLIDQIVEQAGKKFGTSAKSKQPKTLLLNDFDISWEDAVAFSKFPFVAKQTGLLIHRSNLENIRTLITDRDLLGRSVRRLGAMGLQLEQEK
jgi:hypothetical protein